jgi:hypothetical protein
MIDISAEEVRPLSQAAGWVPCFRKGKKQSRRTAATTLWRWSCAGIAGVRLEVVYIGETRCTSKQALARFFQAVTEARAGVSKPAPSRSAGDRTEAKRRKDSEQAAREFEAARVKRRSRKPAVAGS